VWTSAFEEPLYPKNVRTDPLPTWLRTSFMDSP